MLSIPNSALYPVKGSGYKLGLLTKDNNKDEGHPTGHAVTGLKHPYDHNNSMATPVHLGPLLATIEGGA
jgi:hypothetical protein